MGLLDDIFRGLGSQFDPYSHNDYRNIYQSQYDALRNQQANNSFYAQQQYWDNLQKYASQSHKSNEENIKDYIDVEFEEVEQKLIEIKE